MVTQSETMAAQQGNLPKPAEGHAAPVFPMDNYSLLLKGVEGITDYAIFMLDPDGKILTWNTGAERLKGYQAEEIIGQHFSRFYTQEALQNHHPDYELQAAKQQGRYEEDGWRVRKDGSTFWANVILTALYHNGELLGFTKVTRDLTERKQIEDELRQAKKDAEKARESYRLLIEGVKDYAIISLDPQGYVKTWNKGAERIKGYTAEEIIGQHFSMFYPKEDVESGKCEFELQYAETQGFFEDEGWRVRKDGSKLWVNVIITALRDDYGDLIGFSKITRDITERKDMELTLRENERRYRTMADTATRNLKESQKLNQQLEILNKELETFSYSVSHDLRSPLRGIHGYSQAVLEDYGDKLDANGKRYLQRILSESQRMAQLIDDILDLSRVTRGEVHKDTVDLSAIAQAITQNCQEQDPDRSVAFDIQEDVSAHGDKHLLSIVLQNLISNAWKFTSRHPAAHIAFGARFQEGKTVYFVKDDGAGFDQKYAQKLFGVFQRLHGVDEFSGTGIGLATVHRIIHKHGGSIWAEGEVEKGAAFYFTLS